MLRETPLYLRLNPADDVVIACRELEAGTNLLKENVVVRERIPSGHKVATRAVARDSPVRRYNQIIGFATRRHRAGRPRARAQPRSAGVRARLRVRRSLFAHEVRRRARHVPGHRASRRPRGDAQLHRHPLDGELLGDCREARREGLRGRCARFASQCRRRRGAHAHRGLRHGRRGRRHGGAAPHARGLCAARELRRRAHHRPGLRRQPDGRALLYAGLEAGAGCFAP